MAPVRRFLLRLLSFFRSGRAEAELAREIHAHLQLLEDDFLAQGMSPAEARSAARRAFGGVEQVKEHQRDARSFRWLDCWWLDCKLGARMLVKYPGLTLVGGVGMAVAIAIGAVFAATAATVDAKLPMEEPESIVAIEVWDTAVNDQERRILHDFVTWREELRSVETLGAYRSGRRNLIVPGGPAELVEVAEMTASGFQMTRVPPLLGRPLVEADERKEAPPVIVIGYGMWRTHFASDPKVVGREVRLGNAVHTVVGVMPEGFAFPMYHRMWTPFRADPLSYERRQGPGIFVFGRLAPGFTLEDAQAELTAFGQRMAAASPQTHERLRPRAMAYTYQLFDDMEGWEVAAAQILVLLLLVVVCANVAILVYARTVTRLGEITVRNTLGASRHRIVGQLFMEALVLAVVAAAVGLAIADLALMKLDSILRGATGGLMPYWIHLGLSFETVAYALGLAILAAVIVGVVPGLQATGRRLQLRLNELGGSTSLRLGRTWNALIVIQVAFSVALLPAALSMAWQSVWYGVAKPGFAAEEFLTFYLTMEREAPPSAQAETYRREYTARFGHLQAELMRRLEAEPGVSGVTYAYTLPGDERTVWIEIEGVTPPTEAEAQAESPSGYGVRAGSGAGHEVRFGKVGEDFFDVIGVPILAGRRFYSGDLKAGENAVIVNRILVQSFFGGRGAGDVIGRRIRYVGRGGDAGPEDVELGRWYEIVGVVENLPANPIEPGLAEAKLYHPAAPGQLLPVCLAVRVRGAAPETLAGRLREITTSLDSTLRLHEISALDEVYRETRRGLYMGALALAIVTLSVVLLSSAGIYALMSFTVSQRRREIGIRTALGADAGQLLRSIFSRAAGQLAIGVLVGLAAAAAVEKLTRGGLMNGNGVVLLPAVAALMTAVGLLASVGAARRGLRVQPTEALREQ